MEGSRGVGWRAGGGLRKLLELTLALHWSSKGFMSDAVEGALGALSGLCSISMEAFASLYPEPKQHAN